MVSELMDTERINSDIKKQHTKRSFQRNYPLQTLKYLA